MAGGCSLRGGPLTSATATCCATLSSVPCCGPSPLPTVVCAPSACGARLDSTCSLSSCLCTELDTGPSPRAVPVLPLSCPCPRPLAVMPPQCGIFPRHPPLQHLRQLVAGLLLVPKAMLDEGAMSCSCGEQLSRTGRRGEWCRGRRGRVRSSRQTQAEHWQRHRSIRWHANQSTKPADHEFDCRRCL
eukprot:scaffold39762_cov59-Phaeocystis_antarctica.AAC.3